MANATAQAAPRQIDSATTATASDITFETSFYELALGPARFSTDMGQLPRRSIPRFTGDRPCPIIHSDISRDVREKIVALRQKYPTFVRLIKEPKSYRNLYEYFDGYDLWVEGVVFCWHVIATIGNQNAYYNKLADREIDEYAKEWVMFHEDRVICNQNCRDLTELFDEDELVVLDDFLPGQLDTLKAKLLLYRGKLLRDYRERGPTWESAPLRLYPVPETDYPPAASLNQRHHPQSIGNSGLAPPIPCKFNALRVWAFLLTLKKCYLCRTRLEPTADSKANAPPDTGRTDQEACRMRLVREVLHCLRPAWTFILTFTLGNPRVSDIGRRTLSSKGSPQRDEPIYVYNGAEPLNSPTSNRTLGRISGDVRISGLEGLETPNISEPKPVYPHEREFPNGASTL